MAKTGRPTKYNPEYCQLLISFFDIEPMVEKVKTITTKNGSVIEEPIAWANMLPTIEGFCREYGIAKQTLHNWKEKYPAFMDAYTRAKDMQHEVWLQNSLLGHYNPMFSKFAGLNMMGWVDKKEINHTGQINHAHLHADIGNKVDQMLGVHDTDLIEDGT